jgi:hypothetical protein
MADNKKPTAPMSESARALNKIMENFQKLIIEDAKYRKLQRDKKLLKKADGGIIGADSLIEKENPGMALTLKMFAEYKRRQGMQDGGSPFDLDTQIGQLEYLASLSPTNSYEAYIIESARDELAKLKKDLD